MHDPVMESVTPARAGLIGNPSDGYFGRTISCTVGNFCARIKLRESDRIVLEPASRDHSVFGSLRELVEEVRYGGYYGGLRLVKASVKKFYDHAVEKKIGLDGRNFTISYDSDIPLRVGLAGSSAIVISTLRALARFFHVELDRTHLANLALAVETEELAIPAGLQDRVVQSYGGLVFMDFSRQYMEEYGYGRYEELDPALLPPLYIAYLAKVGEGTEVPHSDLRRRYSEGDEKVRRVIRDLADMVLEFRVALEDGKVWRMAELMNRNFDLRAAILPVSEANWKLVNTARNMGLCAKFCGSGGAVVGICESEKDYAALCGVMKAAGAEVIRPLVTSGKAEERK
ncbi:MAG: GHMP kinase [Planctomycetes bacterium]|nr:GHMP kinase [Planctomycetota bacterium]